MNRRELLKGLMAGGIMIAGDLWIPGQKLISIPSKKIYTAPTLFELSGQTIRYVGPEYDTATVSELYDWIKKQFPKIMSGDPYDTAKPHMVSLRHGYRVDKPEHLVEGTLDQDRETDEWSNGATDREHWSCITSLGEDDLRVDKIYQPSYYSTPRERIRENEFGEKGWR